MQEIAKCPLCGGEPTLKYWDYDSDPSIYHCGATLESIAEWNKYAAAMELAEALVWKKEVEDFISYTRCRVQRKVFPGVVKIANNAEDAIYDAEVRARRVFK